MVKPLSQNDRTEVYRLATRSLVHHYGDQFTEGMTDIELETAMKSSLGIFGGSGGPNQLSVSYQGAGLKIWGGWHTVNHLIQVPLFSGNQTIATAREIYNISDPNNNQMNLF